MHFSAALLYRCIVSLRVGRLSQQGRPTKTPAAMEAAGAEMSEQRARFSRRNRLVPVRALLPHLSAWPAIAARLPPDPRTAGSARWYAHPEIRARRDVRPTCPC